MLIIYIFFTAVPSPDLSFQPDEHLEVYVSASENPNHFWIQILGVRSLQLDKLTEEMNNFYRNDNPTVRKVGQVLIVSVCRSVETVWCLIGFTLDLTLCTGTPSRWNWEEHPKTVARKKLTLCSNVFNPQSSG